MTGEYVFDEAFRPDGFEESVRACTSFGVAFYLKGKNAETENDVFAGNRIGDNEVFVWCPKEQRGFSFEAKRGQKVDGEPCPNERYCEQTCYMKNAVYEHKFLVRGENLWGFYQRTDKGVVLRVFWFRFFFSGERYELRRDGEMRSAEVLRVFYNKDRTTEIYSTLAVQYNPHTGLFPYEKTYWEKKKLLMTYADFYLYDTGFAGTLLEGYETYTEYTDEDLKDPFKQAALFLALFKTPALKEVLKAGYDGIALDAVGRATSERKEQERKPLGGALKAHTIRAFFGFEPSKLDKLDPNTKKSLRLNDVWTLRKMVKNGIAVTAESLLICRNARFSELLQRYGGKELREVMRYLQKLKSRAHAVGDYLDYLGQAEELQMDLGDRSVRFPKNFENAHARLSEVLRVKRSKEQSAAFEARAKRFVGYAFRQRNLSLRPVRTVKELTLWAQRFSNCAAGYADRIAEGRSMIFILIDRSTPKKPYYMFEWDPKRREIVQGRTKGNDRDYKDDPAVNAFCGKWLEFIKEKTARHRKAAA